MAIYENIEKFFGKKAEEYNPSEEIADPGDKAFRLSVDWDAFDDDGAEAFEKLFSKFIEDPSVSEAEALIIGDWGGAAQGETSAVVVKSLADAHNKLGNLKALFIGEMQPEFTFSLSF